MLSFTDKLLSLASASSSYLVRVIFLLVLVVDFLVLGVALRVEESPATAVEESFRIIGNCFHNLSPIQGLDTLGVTNIARAKKNNIKSFFYKRLISDKKERLWKN